MSATTGNTAGRITGGRLVGVSFTVEISGPGRPTQEALLPILRERGLGVGPGDLVEVKIRVTHPTDPSYERKQRAHQRFLESQRGG